MPDDRPNILLLMTDQHRADGLGIEGHPVLQTPWLDHLAASGARFRRAYSACPICVAEFRSTSVADRASPRAKSGGRLVRRT